MPTLAVRELVYCTDEKALYIGTSAGNVKLCAAALEGIVNGINGTVNAHGQSISSLQNSLNSLSGTVGGHGNSINSLNSSVNSLSQTAQAHQQGIENLKTQMANKLTANPVQAQAAVAADADTAAIVTAVNNLIAAMKASGVMKN